VRFRAPLSTVVPTSANVTLANWLRTVLNARVYNSITYSWLNAVRSTRITGKGCAEGRRPLKIEQAGRGFFELARCCTRNRERSSKQGNNSIDKREKAGMMRLHLQQEIDHKRKWKQKKTVGSSRLMVKSFGYTLK
jgi:hypothetical protein